MFLLRLVWGSGVSGMPSQAFSKCLASRFEMPAAAHRSGIRSRWWLILTGFMLGSTVQFTGHPSPLPSPRSPSI